MYINEMFEILSPIYHKEIHNLNVKTKFNRKIWNSLFKEIKSSNNYVKGKSLEDLANYFLSCIKDIKVTGRNIRHFTEEIDLCFCNYSNDSVLWKLGSLILVECKNHTKKIPAKTIRNLSYIMESKGITTTFLFTASSLTKPALDEIEKAKNMGKYFIIIYLEELLTIKNDPQDFLRAKINYIF